MSENSNGDMGENGGLWMAVDHIHRCVSYCLQRCLPLFIKNHQFTPNKLPSLLHIFCPPLLVQFGRILGFIETTRQNSILLLICMFIWSSPRCHPSTAIELHAYVYNSIATRLVSLLAMVLVLVLIVVVEKFMLLVCTGHHTSADSYQFSTYFP